MPWEVEYTDEFGTWWDTLTAGEQHALSERVALLEAEGPLARRPVVGEVKGSKLGAQLKELRVSVGQSELRVLFVFDPRQVAILLLGGNKAEAGWNRWYRSAVRDAERLYDAHLAELRREGLI